jgi:hypothetical protein
MLSSANLQRLQNKQNSMYSPAGASFQEWALRLLDAKGSTAHKSIGSFVTAINNGKMTIAQAEVAYTALLSK